MTGRKRTNEVDMLHGSLWDKLLLFALPLAASSILQQLFNAADVAVVGRFAGSEALAAVGANVTVVNLFVNCIAGLSVGPNVVIATLIGQNKRELISKVVHTVIAVALAGGLAFTLFGELFGRTLLTLIGTPDTIFDKAELYLRIYLCAIPFIFLFNFGAAILRSVGDCKRPLWALIVSGIVNVLLNLLFVVGFHLAVVGVALATVFSNVISALMVMVMLMREQKELRLRIKDLRIEGTHLKRVLAIGAPSALQASVFSIANVCIQSGINTFGAKAIAGSSVELNYEFITYFVISAFNQTCVTFTSQNFGAGEMERCKRIFRLCMTFGLSICFLFSVTFVWNRELLMSLFTNDEAVIEYAVTRLICVCSLEMLTGTYEISGAAMRGMGHSLWPALLTVIGSVCFRILWLVTVFAHWHSFEVLMLVYPASWVLTGAMVLPSYFSVRKREFARLS